MSHVTADDLNDALLAPLAGNYLDDVEAWIVEQADMAGVSEAQISATLKPRAKRAAIYRLAIATCLGEGGQNQHVMGGDGRDVFAVKLSQYKTQLDDLLKRLSASDWADDLLPEADRTVNLCPRLYRA
jgi:hypothetical protein